MDNLSVEQKYGKRCFDRVEKYGGKYKLPDYGIVMKGEMDQVLMETYEYDKNLKEYERIVEIRAELRDFTHLNHPLSNRILNPTDAEIDNEMWRDSKWWATFMDQLTAAKNNEFLGFSYHPNKCTNQEMIAWEDQLDIYRFIPLHSYRAFHFMWHFCVLEQEVCDSIINETWTSKMKNWAKILNHAHHFSVLKVMFDYIRKIVFNARVGKDLPNVSDLKQSFQFMFKRYRYDCNRDSLKRTAIHVM